MSDKPAITVGNIIWLVLGVGVFAIYVFIRVVFFGD